MLKFYSKVTTQHILSLLPRGDSIYRWLQDNVTKSTPPSKPMVQEKLNRAQSYIQILEDFRDMKYFREGTLLDFGSGYHFTIPLAFYELGSKSQLLIDYKRIAREETVFPIVDLIPRCKYHKRPIRALPNTDNHNLDTYLPQLGIKYVAPVSGRIPADDKSISVITMTSVLQYPSRAQVRQILEESARVLKPGGYLIGMIDLSDQYHLFDESLSHFNFLRYEEKVWNRWFRNKFAGNNRLRPSDYDTLLEGIPLKKMVWDKVTHKTVDFRKELNRIKISSDFAGYTQEDLGAYELFFALKRG